MDIHAVAALLLVALAIHADRRCTAAELASVCGATADEAAAAVELLRVWGLVQERDGLLEAPAAPATDRAVVLVVENTPAVAHVAAALLESEGYAVLIAATLALGEQVLGCAPVLLVICDSFAGTAQAAVERLAPVLRAAGDVPVLLFTAHRDLTEEQVRAAGFAGLLPKPFDIDELLARVEAAIGGG